MAASDQRVQCAPMAPIALTVMHASLSMRSTSSVIIPVPPRGTDFVVMGERDLRPVGVRSAQTVLTVAPETLTPLILRSVPIIVVSVVTVPVMTVRRALSMEFVSLALIALIAVRGFLTLMMSLRAVTHAETRGTAGVMTAGSVQTPASVILDLIALTADPA